jgi:uncharacterized protein YbjT (DUF2867 family)
MKIAVAGATGRVGRHVVDVATERGHEVVKIARATGVDVITGEGLDDALDGVDVLVDAATWPTSDQEQATEFFVTAVRNLQAAGARAGVRQAVVVSIIGTDRFRAGYGAAKIAHERAWRTGPIPARVLRAAQFHEFVAQMLDWTTQGEIAYVPVMRTQLVAARSVAERLVDLATTPGSGDVSEIAGPRAESLAAVAILLAERRGAPLKVEEVRQPDDPDAELQAGGGLLPGPGAVIAGPTYAEWLDGSAAGEGE